MATAQRLSSSGDFCACLTEIPQTVSTASGLVEYAERARYEPILAIHVTLDVWD
ncbi:hypothetical protein [Cryobacterium sp. Y50]|uniref:hypothetical protein n=1 Tax=Cryobacterium sp. Y50 TaxID=2048286 RepID=UPI001304BD31|nr:hypothetical protein [Cryobacterium sp. Y50]